MTDYTAIRNLATAATTEEIVGILEQEPNGESFLLAINEGYPASEQFECFLGENPDRADAIRIARLETEGLSTSDAQAAADAEKLGRDPVDSPEFREDDRVDAAFVREDAADRGVAPVYGPPAEAYREALGGLSDQQIRDLLVTNRLREERTGGTGQAWTIDVLEEELRRRAATPDADTMLSENAASRKNGGVAIWTDDQVVEALVREGADEGDARSAVEAVKLPPQGAWLSGAELSAGRTTRTEEQQAAIDRVELRELPVSGDLDDPSTWTTEADEEPDDEATAAAKAVARRGEPVGVRDVRVGESYEATGRIVVAKARARWIGPDALDYVVDVEEPRTGLRWPEVVAKLRTLLPEPAAVQVGGPYAIPAGSTLATDAGVDLSIEGVVPPAFRTVECRSCGETVREGLVDDRGECEDCDGESLVGLTGRTDIDGTRFGIPPAAATFSIAVELLELELERLEVDHYSDGKPTDCDGCQRAATVRREIDGLAEKVVR